MTFELIVVGNNCVPAEVDSLLSRRSKRDRKKQTTETQKILPVIHMTLERERIQEILDTKNTLLLNIIFQIFGWDTSGM